MVSEQVSHTIIRAEEAIFYQDFGNAGRMHFLASLTVHIPIIKNHLNEILIVDDSRYPEVHSRLDYLLLIIGEIFLLDYQLNDGKKLILERLEID